MDLSFLDEDYMVMPDYYGYSNKSLTYDFVAMSIKSYTFYKGLKWCSFDFIKDVAFDKFKAFLNKNLPGNTLINPLRLIDGSFDEDYFLDDIHELRADLIDHVSSIIQDILYVEYNYTRLEDETDYVGSLIVLETLDHYPSTSLVEFMYVCSPYIDLLDFLRANLFFLHSDLFECTKKLEDLFFTFLEYSSIVFEDDFTVCGFHEIPLLIGEPVDKHKGIGVLHGEDGYVEEEPLACATIAIRIRLLVRDILDKLKAREDLCALFDGFDEFYSLYY